MTLIDLDLLNSTERGYVDSLLARTNNNQALTRQILAKLVIELPRQVEEVKSAFALQQFITAQNIVHKLHGSVSFCGFSDLEEIARKLETCLIANEISQAQAEFKALQKKITEFVSLKDKWLI